MKKISSILVVILILALFTGCTSDFKVNDVVVKDISDKITQAVIETVDSNIKAERQETQTLDYVEQTELNIKGEVGDIRVITHDLNEIIVDANIKAKANSKERAEEMVNSFVYTVESKWGKVNIDTTGYNEKTNNEQIIVDLVIRIPQTLEKTIIITNVGDINLEDIYGTINCVANVGDINIKNSSTSNDIKTDVGDVNMQNVSLSGESSFYSNVGDIVIASNDISTAKSLSIETQVGDIKLSLPKSASYEANIHEFMQKPKTELAGTGKTKINLVTNVGDINLE